MVLVMQKGGVEPGGGMYPTAKLYAYPLKLPYAAYA